MNKYAVNAIRLAAAVLVMSAAPMAMANGPQVSWSVNVGSGYPAPVYAPPPVVYVEPQPVYVRPQPVYVVPQSTYVYGQPYYVEEFRYKKFKHGHWKHHHD